jgi:hypothetical protein
VLLLTPDSGEDELKLSGAAVEIGEDRRSAATEAWRYSSNGIPSTA